MPQVIVQVMYPPSSRFDWDYYKSTHMIMAGKEFDLVSWEVAKGIDSVLPSTYQAIATLVFASREVFEASFARVAPKLLADIPTYTDAQPVIQVTEFQGSGKKT
jgi:uncharacterized protein (TIGR02118 family)